MKNLIQEWIKHDPRKGTKKIVPKLPGGSGGSSGRSSRSSRRVEG